MELCDACRSDDENAQCSASGACEVCRNSPLSILPCTIISTRNATSIHDKTSSSTVPSLSPSGGNSVPGKFTLFAGNGDWFESI